MTIAQKAQTVGACTKSNGTSLYVPGKGLPSGAIRHVKAVFDDLPNDSLLMKCLHGKTQNQNESFNWDDLESCTKVSFHQI